MWERRIVGCLAVGAALLLGGCGGGSGTATTGGTDTGAPADLTKIVVPARAALFMQVDGIPGESTDAAHAGWIDLSSITFGSSNSSEAATGGGAGAGKVSFDNIVIKKPIDKASPLLLAANWSGKHISKVSIAISDLGRRGKSNQVYLIEAENVLIALLHQTINGDQTANSTEEVALSFSKIKITYWPQKADGSVDQPLTASFDVNGNQVAARLRGQ